MAQHRFKLIVPFMKTVMSFSPFRNSVLSKLASRLFELYFTVSINWAADSVGVAACNVFNAHA